LSPTKPPMSARSAVLTSPGLTVSDGDIPAPGRNGIGRPLQRPPPPAPGSTSTGIRSPSQSTSESDLDEESSTSRSVAEVVVAATAAPSAHLQTAEVVVAATAAPSAHLQTARQRDAPAQRGATSRSQRLRPSAPLVISLLESGEPPAEGGAAVDGRVPVSAAGSANPEVHLLAVASQDDAMFTVADRECITALCAGIGQLYTRVFHGSVASTTPWSTLASCECQCQCLGGATLLGAFRSWCMRCQDNSEPAGIGALSLNDAFNQWNNVLKVLTVAHFESCPCCASQQQQLKVRPSVYASPSTSFTQCCCRWCSSERLLSIWC
jgi:hypothetical protein